MRRGDCVIYLGTLGRLVSLKCPAAQASAVADPFTVETTVEGRVKAQRRPLARRSWSLDTRVASPREVAALAEFTTGVWGRGPFVFVSADAPVVNLLTPEESSLDPSVLAGGPSGGGVLDSPPMLTPDGWAGRSLLKRDGVFARIAERIPVIPGRPVTGSAYVRADAQAAFVRLQFVRADGSEVSQHNSPTAFASVERRWVTATVPYDAAWANLWVTGSVVQVARPAVTWTAQPFEYGDGQGCKKAVVRPGGRDLLAAWRTPGISGRWSDLSFTVQEVG